MSDRPILFSAPMVRAILSGAKTQTRRLVKPSMYLWEGQSEDDCEHIHQHDPRFGAKCVELARCPFGVLGDRLWVRETWHNCPHCGAGTALYRAGGWLKRPRVDGPDRDDSDTRPLNPKCAAHGWRPSIHMPRWASRITLEVTGVRVERLNDISEEDAKAEGAAYRLSPGGDLAGAFEPMPGEALPPINYRSHFRDLWESINDPGSWALNPWVWVVEFKRVTP